jgi:hypothetical protein
VSNWEIHFSIRRDDSSCLYVVRWTIWFNILEWKDTYILVMFFVYDSICLFHVKIIGLSSLECLLPV